MVVDRNNGAGQALATRCENHNRCAGCGETLADWRLSAYHYDEAHRRVCYVAAYSAFSHRCR